MSNVRESTMLDTFDIKGLWSIEPNMDDKDAKQVSGILRYNPQRITLELIGTFSEGESLYKNGLTQRTEAVDHIFGYSDNGERITLFDCHPIEERSAIPGFNTTTYVISMMYVGCILESEEKDSEGVSFSYTNIDAWIQHDVFLQSESGNRHSLTVDMGEAKADLNKINIPQIKCDLSEEIKWTSTRSKDYTKKETCSMSIEHYYNLCPLEKKPISVKDFFEIVHSIKRLITLLIGTPMYIKYIDYTFQNSVDAMSMRKDRCRLFFSQIGDCSGVSTINPYNPQSVLIGYNEIIKELPGILNTWFAKIDCFDETIRPYINGRYLSEFLETEFMNVVRGLEAHHRFFIESNDKRLEEDRSPFNTEKTEEQNAKEKIVAFINDNVSEEMRGPFIEKVEYENEASFRTRIKELIVGLPNRLQSIIYSEMNSRQRKTFIQTIVDTRNYYTHHDNIDKYSHAVSEPYLLNEITKKLTIILVYYSLRELGIDTRIVEKGILHSRALRV